MHFQGPYPAQTRKIDEELLRAMKCVSHMPGSIAIESGSEISLIHIILLMFHNDCSPPLPAHQGSLARQSSATGICSMSGGVDNLNHPAGISKTPPPEEL